MNTPTPETNEFASAKEAPTENCWYHFARKLERQRDAAREDAERLADALNRLMQCADPNINNCSDDELREAIKHGFAREIIEQAEAFLETRQALAAHKALKAGV